MGKLPISKEKTSKGKGGFTLVELSIVLVIIGLLIGGILAAQSMISTAKINATVRQIGQFDAGVMAFKSKYNYLAGDAPAFGGNGNGLIEFTGFTTCGSACLNAVTGNICEIANFWNNLFPEQYASSVCDKPGAKPIAAGASKNVPLSKLGLSGSFFIASALAGGDNQYADPTHPENFYFILAPTEAQNLDGGGYYEFPPTTSSTSAIRPADLSALDSKMDDGIANTGNVLSGAIHDAGVGVGGITINPLATCSLGANYNVQNDSEECTPLIRIGGSTGDLQ